MLTKLSIQNFKAFGKPACELDLSPLTILVGPNGSGKTSVLEALGLLAQSANPPGQDGFRWRGQWVDFQPNGQPALHRGDPNAEMMFGIKAVLDAFDKFDNVSHENLPDDDHEIEYSVYHRRKGNYWRHVCVLSGTAIATTTFESRPNKGPILVYENAGISGVYAPQVSAGAILSPQIFQPGQVDQRSTTMQYAEASKKAQRFLRPMSRLANFMAHGVYLVGPNRAPKKEEQDFRKYDLSVGRAGQETLNLLSYLFASPEHDEAAEKIEYWANAFDLGKLKAGWARQKQLQAGFSDHLTKTPLSLEYSGYGSQQVLPVITQIFAAPKGSVVMIEEPEISLHPSAQVEVMRLFGDAIKYGQQILLTTHSQILPLAVSTLQEYSLRPDQIVIYHLSRNADSVSAQRLELDDKWNIRGWIPSFSQVDSKLLKTWISKVHDDIQR